MFRKRFNLGRFRVPICLCLYGPLELESPKGYVYIILTMEMDFELRNTLYVVYNIPMYRDSNKWFSKIYNFTQFILISKEVMAIF